MNVIRRIAISTAVLTVGTLAVSAASANAAHLRGGHGAGTLTASAGRVAAAATPVYAALGDSVAAGEGNKSLVAPCDRSQAGYPHLLAAGVFSGYSLDDVACTGAQTLNILSGGSPEYVNGVQLAQTEIDQLGSTPISVATITVGVDDLNWVSTLTTCILDGYQYCDSYAPDIHNEILDVEANLEQISGELRGNPGSPKIYITGYYDPFPSVGSLVSVNNGCPAGFTAALLLRYADGTIGLINSWETQLNDAIQQAASATGAQYVNLVPAFPSAHRMCTLHPWIYPYGSPGLAAFHPDVAGQESIASAITAAVPTNSGPQWQAPQLLGAGNLNAQPIGTDGAGNLTVGWEDPAANQVFADQRPPGTFAWPAPTLVLSSPDAPLSGPDISVAPSGDAVLWGENPDGGGAMIRTTPTGSFSPLPEITGTSLGMGFPTYFIDNAGDATAVWVQGHGSGSTTTATIDATTLAAGSTTWGPFISLDKPAPWGTASFEGSESGPGLLAVSWTQGSKLQVATDQIGQPWSAPKTVSPSGLAGASEQAISVNASGDVIVAWAGGTATGRVLGSRYLPAGGNWGKVETIPYALPAFDSNGISIALSELGTSTIAWESYVNQDNFREPHDDLAQSVAGNAWTIPEVIAQGNQQQSAQFLDPLEPHVVMDAYGNAEVVWEAQENATGDYQSQPFVSLHPVGGHWTAPVALEPPVDQLGFSYRTDPVQPVITPDGYPTVAWGITEEGSGGSAGPVYAYTATALTPFFTHG